MTQIAATLAVFAMVVTSQGAGMLRVRVVLTDASGVETPIPRLMLLISDNPPAAEPRRIRTDAEGSIAVRLAPGSYTVETDEPIAFRGSAYTWTQIIEVPAGRDTIVDLTTANAEKGGTARISADSATLLTAWRDSIVEIWTPTKHASGFVIDSARGLIATSHHALGGASAVEVQLTAGHERIKVPGRVLVSEKDPGAAIIWIDPHVVDSTRSIDAVCGSSAPAVNYKDAVSTITASMLANKEVTDGIVTRVTPQAIFSDMRIGSDSEGGPVFAESGTLLGVSAIDNRDNSPRWNEAWIVPRERACTLVAAAVAKTTGATAPAGTRLPMDPVAGAVKTIATSQGPAAANTAKAARPTLSSSDFDIALITKAQLRNNTPGVSSLREDFGTWSDYVRDMADLLLVRVSPQFEESMWKLLARGAAATQGVRLPPLKSFTANFLQLRAYCGDAEVLPIHPFIVEHEVPGRAAIREGLYVFERTAFGAQCPAITFSVFSERDPQRADTKVIDFKLFEQLIAP